MSNSIVEQCMDSIRNIENALQTAKRNLIIGKENCIVNKAAMDQLLATLKSNLPAAMPTAEEYVKNITAIREQTDQECAALRQTAQQESQQQITAANQQAAETVENANRQAAATIEKANLDANTTVEAARQEAARIVDEANRHAAMLVSQQEIVRRAKVEASEAREAAERDMAVLRKNTFDYLESTMEQADRFLTDAISSIRMERGELNSHR